MRHGVLFSLLIALGGTAALAQNAAVIKERKSHLEAMGKALKAPTKMYKGDADFELGKVLSTLKVIQEKGGGPAEALSRRLEDRGGDGSPSRNLGKQDRLHRSVSQALCGG